MAKKNEKTNALSVKGQFSQEDIPALLEKVNSQIKALKGDDDETGAITGTLGVFGKISDITDTTMLRGAYAYITKKGEAISSYDNIFKEAAPLAKVGVYKEGGATVEQWQKEIVRVYKKVAHKEQIEKLEKTKKALQENLSAKDKLAATLADIADSLND